MRLEEEISKVYVISIDEIKEKFNINEEILSILGTTDNVYLYLKSKKSTY